MKTKHLTFVLAIAIAFVIASCSNKNAEEIETEAVENIEEIAVEATDYSIDIENSRTGWKGSMIGVYSHEGDLLFSEGNLSVADGKITAGSFTMDMNSMITTDDDALYKMAPREKLIGHLQADDFFSVADFPTSTFVIKSHEGNTIVGDLTIKGVTNEETLTDVLINEENGTVTASGNLVFDRQLYNVAYEHKMNDMVLSNDIELKILLIGIAE